MVKSGKFVIELKQHMSYLIGTYECKVDAKGRLMLPSGLKRQLVNVVKHGFVLKKAVFGKGLELYPMEEWTIINDQINKLNRFNQRNVKFIRGFNAGARLTEIDSTGRLLVPKELAVWAGIESQIVITASGKILEIWDKQEYENSLMSNSEFSELAQKVMGGENDDESRLDELS